MKILRQYVLLSETFQKRRHKKLPFWNSDVTRCFSLNYSERHTWSIASLWHLRYRRRSPWGTCSTMRHSGSCRVQHPNMDTTLGWFPMFFIMSISFWKSCFCQSSACSEIGNRATVIYLYSSSVVSRKNVQKSARISCLTFFKKKSRFQL